MFSLIATSPVRCPCGSVVDQFGDHLLGCGHGPMRYYYIIIIFYYCNY